MLIEINPNQFEEIYSIMETSFPQDERRPYAKQKALLDLSCYHIYAQLNGSNMQIQGFLAAWDIPSSCFIEHFAVNPLYRNQGLGANMLQELMQQQTKPICLEVELPETELAIRRIHFYERNGLYLNTYSYVQPPLDTGQQAIPLYLMTSGHALAPSEFASLQKEIMQHVYHTA
ncbi:MAG: GNAT family N-acetyltransferase [Lachnospiraceae bacterium]|nr:GNAT family N-acetyltransferase [Lachnospiraceae bacterium]HCJ07127.1 N-acetyltransferase [Lachnospiraceae bacterium]